MKKIFLLISLVLCIFLILNDIEEEILAVSIYQKEKPGIQNKKQIMKLEIPELNFTRSIIIGNVNKIDRFSATLLEKNHNNQIIVGHNIVSVFHDLHYLKTGMYVYFTDHFEKKKYQVTKILTVDPTEVKYLDETEKEQLTLITCTKNDQKRLIIICNRLDYIS